MKTAFLKIAVASAMVFSSFLSFGTTYTVNANTWTNTGAGTLGDLPYCINQANADASVGPHTIQFTAGVTGPITFSSISIGNPTQRIIINGETATGAGCGNPTVVLQGVAWNNTLTLAGAGVVLRALNIQQAKLSLTTGTSEIYSCWFNLNAAGSAGSALNSVGGATFMTISGGTNHIIGLDNCNRNVFSMNVNDTWGPFITISGANGTTFDGNYFGTDRTGLVALSNHSVGIGTLNITGATSNLSIINNVISGALGSQGRAITVNSAIDVSGLIIGGNIIGMDANGNVAAGFGNGNGGIYLRGNCTGNNITIADNDIGRTGITNCDINSCGMIIESSFTNVTISGNYLGTTRTFANAGNPITGMFVVSTINNLTISNNVIGFNGFGCVNSHGGEITNCTNVTFTGNYIGVSPTSVNIGNNTSGFVFASCSNVSITGNFIGNNGGARNIANGGLVLNGGSDIIVQNNRIGVAPDGTACGQQNLGGNGRGGNGITIEDALRVKIGGTAANEYNIIASSVNNGINAFETASGTCDFIEMRYNSIYCNGTKGINLNYGGNAANAGLVAPVLTGTPYPDPTLSAIGTKPANTRVDVFGTSQCAVNCTTTPQGQLYKGEATTYSGGTAGTNWDFTPGGNIFDYLTALATGATGTANCTSSSGVTYCRTSEFSTCEDNQLPVEFAEIIAIVNQDGSVTVKWKTSAEINNDYFVVMRSEDGEHFVAIGQVEGNGNTAGSYTFTDLYALSGDSYYKIKQVDLDDTFSYSEVVTVNSKTSSFKIYPVPASDKVIVEGISNSSLVIYDVVGKLVKNLIIGENEINQIEISDLAKGTYLVYVKTINGLQVAKLIKE